MNDELPYGQKRLLRLFSGSNHDVVFIPHDPFDMRICGALTHRGLLRPTIEDGYRGYELTDDGRAVVAEINAPLSPTPPATTCIETIDGDPETALRLSFQIKVF